MSRRTKILTGIIGAFIALFLAFAIPFIIRARNVGESFPCLNNLRLIDGAKQQWILENPRTTNDTPTWEDIRFFYLGHGQHGPYPPKCPQGGTYTIGKVGENPKCSYPDHALE